MRGRPMRFFALVLIFSLAYSTAYQANEGSDRIEPALAGRKDVLLFCGFETDDWWRAWGMQKPPDNTSLVDGEGAFKGRSLKVTVRRDEHMGTSFAYKFRQQTGAEPEEIYFRYYLKFDPSWRNATSGGKLPGISGTYGRAGWGGRRVNGSDGWSARGLFDTRPGASFTTVGFYCYHADMKGIYGEHWAFKPSLQHGRWYSVEQYCKLNAPADAAGKGRNDGILRGWIDGELAFEKTDIRFRDLNTLRIEEIWMNVYHGGATPVPGDDIHLYLDNIVIARAPIGLAKVEQSQRAGPRSLNDQSAATRPAGE